MAVAMTVSAPDALAGELVATPGPGAAALRSSRRELAPRLARGQPAAALPALLGAVFTLCGGAHRLAAGAAVAAARGSDRATADAEREGLRGDTLREHLRRIFLDWPRALPWPGEAPDAAVLAACPLWRDPLAIEASRGWIERHLLGEPAEDWAAGWRRSPVEQARRWASAGASAPARWWQAAEPWLAGLQLAPRRLAVHGHADDLRTLASTLALQPLDADAGLALVPRPTWQGEPAETGPWARLADDDQRVGASAPPALRLAARVAEVAELLLPEGGRRLALGALPIRDGEGLAWCEMARGLLVHWVRLAPAAQPADQRVAACRVLAPTDWNFHPAGAMARLLAGLSPDAPAQQVRLLAAAFDPCVALRIERQAVADPHAEEPRCTR